MQPDTERRKHPRNTFVRSIEYTLPHREGTSGEESARGVTVNMSLNGLCLYLFKPLPAGQELKIARGVPGKRNLKAIVQWIEQITVDTYKAGLHFTST